MDILQTYYTEMSATNKLYFKVEIDDSGHSEGMTSKKNHSLVIKKEKRSARGNIDYGLLEKIKTLMKEPVDLYCGIASL